MSEQYVYEAHNIHDPLLPFIFHPLFTHIGPTRRINWHKNIEILHCTDGSGYVQYGAKQISFSKGDLMIINADTLHSVGSICPISYQCLIIDNSFFLENGIQIDLLCFQNRINDPELSRLFREIALAYAQHVPGVELSAALIRLSVLSFMIPLCRNYSSKMHTAVSASDPCVKMAIKYIRNHLRDTITLDDLSGHTGLSKYHLSRQFKTATSMSIIEYINLSRCLEAKRLIENGDSVSIAALSCGFNNLSYFSRTYKKHLGELPSSAIRK